MKKNTEKDKAKRVIRQIRIWKAERHHILGDVITPKFFNGLDRACDEAIIFIKKEFGL